MPKFPVAFNVPYRSLRAQGQAHWRTRDCASLSLCACVSSRFARRSPHCQAVKMPCTAADPCTRTSRCAARISSAHRLPDAAQNPIVLRHAVPAPNQSCRNIEQESTNPSNRYSAVVMCNVTREYDPKNAQNGNFVYQWTVVLLRFPGSKHHASRRHTSTQLYNRSHSMLSTGPTRCRIGQIQGQPLPASPPSQLQTGWCRGMACVSHFC